MGVVVRQKIKGKGRPWWVFVCHKGQRRSFMVGTREAATAAAKEIEAKLLLGKLDLAPKAMAPKIPTFGEYAEKWLESYGEVSLKPSTLTGYYGILKRYLKPLEARPIDEITRSEIRDLLLAKLKDGLAPATVTRIKALISSVFTYAVEDGLVTANPASRLGRLIKSKDPKADVQPLSRDEARAFLEVVGEHYPRYYPFFLCALRTGLRLGELRALEWGDIDFQGGFIEVRRAYVQGSITTPKSRKSRQVDMSPQLAETLKALQVERKKEALARGWREVPELVFIDSNGGILDDSNLRGRVFYRALALAGFRRIRIHDLRHTFASMLIQNGESLAYVRDQLGHHSIKITVDIYGHLEAGANKKAVARLDDDFEPEKRVQIGSGV
jgi:integrase